MKLKVYISSPYTVGEATTNVRKQLDMGSILMDMGMVPFIPLLAHFVQMTHPKSYTDWLAYDFEWVKSCNVLLRLRGKSAGADLEERTAIDNGIPVFREMTDLIDYARANDYEIERIVPYTVIQDFERINGTGV